MHRRQQGGEADDCADRGTVPGPAPAGRSGRGRRCGHAVRPNLKALAEAKFRFIVGSRTTKAPLDLASHFRWHGDAFADGQIIDTITPRVATTAARKVNDPAVKAEPVWDPAAHTLSWRAVWAYSHPRAQRDRKTLGLQEERAKAVVNGEKSARTPRFVTAGKDGHSLDRRRWPAPTGWSV